jgi:VanZ family protein
MGRTHTHDSAPDANNLGEGARRAANQAGSMANQAGNKTRNVISAPWFAALARLGYAAKGLVYIVIGWLALMTAVSAGGQTTDPQGAITTIYQHPFGKALLFIIFIGFVGYALWQFARAAFNPDGEGDARKDTVRRIGYAAVGVSYLGFALAALRLMLQNTAPKGSNASTQDWTARLLAAPFGVFLVVLLGLIVLGVAVGLFYEAWKLRFERYFPLGQMNDVERKLTRYTGRFGIGALGVIFVIIAIFLIEAALHHDPHKAQGLAGALATLAAQPFGPLLLGLIALGLIAYGVFGWVEARYRRIHV